MKKACGRGEGVRERDEDGDCGFLVPAWGHNHYKLTY